MQSPWIESVSSPLLVLFSPTDEHCIAGQLEGNGICVGGRYERICEGIFGALYWITKKRDCRTLLAVVIQAGI
jgi:hypothetical protein